MRAAQMNVFGAAARKGAWTPETLVMGAGILIAGGLGALVVAPPSVVDPALIAIIGGLCITPIAFRAAQGRFDPFEPIVIICAASFVILFLRPIWMWRFDEWTFTVFDARDGFTGAATIGALGIAAIIAGYSLSFGGDIARRLPAINDGWDPRRVTRACLLIIVLAVFLFLFHIGTEGGLAALRDQFSGRSAGDTDLNLTRGGQRRSSSYFALAPLMTIPVALLLLEVWRRLRSPAAAVLGCSAVALALLMTVPRGDRTWVLALLLPLVVIFYLNRQRRPNPLGILLTVVISILIANVLLDYRRIENRTQSLGQTTVEAFADPLGGIDQFLLGVDTSMFTVLAIEHSEMDRIGYRPGQQLTSIVLGPIPGALWRGKPQAPSQEVYLDLFSRPGVRTKPAGFAVSMFGSFYADSAYVGVIIYSLLFGILLRALFEYWRTNPTNRSVIMAYALLLPILIIMFRASATLAFGAVLVLLGPLLGAFWWGNRGSRGSSEVAAPVGS